MREEKPTQSITSRLKIVIYAHDFLPVIGGVQTHVELLARGLTKFHGIEGSPEFEIIVVTNTPAGAFDDNCFSFRVVRNPTVSELVRLIRKTQVLHVTGPALLPLLLARLFRRPTVVEHHGYQAICPNGLLLHEPDRAVCPGHFQAGRLGECFRCQCSELSSARRSLFRLVLTKMRNVLCRHVENIAVTKHVQNREALPRSRVIYHGIEDVLMGKSDVSAGLSIPKKVCFAYVGRLVFEKGVGVLLNAASQLQKEGCEFDIILIGDGPERAGLDRQITRLGLESRVRITGFLGGPELSSLLQQVHVVVMPSVWEETAGLSAIEQMMRGRLVIASAIGGLAEVVGDAGVVCPPGDAEALAASMSSVIAHPEQIATFGIKARARCLSVFGYERMLKEHAEVYRRAAAEPRV
jgi:glycosyltransferase involved in cell wall biosynthesis